MLNRVLLAGVLAVSIAATPVGPAGADETWSQVGVGITNGISGLAPAASGWVVARDNKLAGQNRISLMSDAGALTALTWPGSAPADLESLAAVPGETAHYAALTSTGSGTVFTVSGTSVVVIRKFTVPRGSANIESFALTKLNNLVVAVWATRGSPSKPARVFAATFDATSGVFGRVVAGPVTVPYPVANVRHVSDLALVGGALTGAAASDPGNNGPFTSALYRLGTVSTVSGRARLTLPGPVLLETFAGHKIEGIACAGVVGLLATDDENQGSSIRNYDFCG